MQDKVGKVQLLERIQGRRKKLKNLRKLDREKFEWLCNELKIKYVAVPEFTKKYSKRSQRQKDAREAALNVRLEKLEVYRSKLEEQRKLFETFKQQELDDISKEMASLGLEMGDSLNSALIALDEKPIVVEKPKKRRQLLLAMKFEMYKDNPPRGKNKPGA